MDLVVTVLLTVLMFSILIFIHEFGHFITAKLFKVKVNEFALGMGPKILKFQKGETLYSIRALPIGGFVSMEGEEEESEHPRAFKKQKVWKRIIICSAGVFMNFLLGLAIAVSLVATDSSPYLASTTVAGVVNEDVQGDTLREGDKIISVAGYRIFSGDDIFYGVTRSDPTGKSELIELETEFVVIRDGKKTTLKNVRPFVRVTNEDKTQQDRYNFYVQPENKDFFGVLRHGFFEAVSYVRTTVLGLSDLITGRVGIDSLGSVIKVGQVVGEASKYGLSNLLYLMAIISVNLGVMNFLPIPALDGGRVLLLAYEGIFRKKVNQKVETILIAGSMILLFGLMLLVGVKDILSFF